MSEPIHSFHLMCVEPLHLGVEYYSAVWKQTLTSETEQIKKESNGPAANSKRAEHFQNTKQLFGLSTLSHIQDEKGLWVSTGTKMEPKILAGHFNVRGQTEHQHGKNSRVTLKSAMFCSLLSKCPGHFTHGDRLRPVDGHSLGHRPQKPLLWCV